MRTGIDPSFAQYVVIDAADFNSDSIGISFSGRKRLFDVRQPPG